MGFSFEFAGPRRLVVDLLDGLLFERDLHEDPMGDEVRSFISRRLKVAGDEGPGLQYVVKVSGHGGPDSERHTIWLNAYVAIEPVNADLSGHELAEEGGASDALAIGG